MAEYALIKSLTSKEGRLLSKNLVGEDYAKALDLPLDIGYVYDTQHLML